MRATQAKMAFAQKREPSAAVARFLRYHEKRPHISQAFRREARRLARGAKISLCIHTVYWHARNRHSVRCPRNYLPAFAWLLEGEGLHFEHKKSVFSSMEDME